MSLLLALAIVSVGFAVGFEVNDPCVTPCNLPGRCVPVGDCSYARKLAQKTNQTNEDAFLEKSKCGFAEGMPLFCCPHLLNPEGCGASLDNRIFFGTFSIRLDDHPWAALLMYDTTKGRIIPKCGGSLLNKRYVLTAAHCIRNIPGKYKFVRFGAVYDAIGDENCIEDKNGGKICRQDFGIEQITVHPDYDKHSKNKQHDIALVKLSNDVTFGKYVQPICLPFDQVVAEMPIEDELFTVTGWDQGRGNFGKFQYHFELKGKSNDLCNEVYATANLTLTENHLCVGGVAGRDFHKGDSGGPLLRIVATKWYQIGVQSFVSNKGKSLPGVYINVVKYLDWISDVVNENHCHKI